MVGSAAAGALEVASAGSTRLASAGSTHLASAGSPHFTAVDPPAVPVVSVGVDYVVEGGASITFVYFVAVVMLTVLAARFGYYATRNGLANDRATLRPLWWSLALAGLAAVVYGVLAVVDVVSSLATPYRRAFLLAHVLAVGVAIRTLGREAKAGTQADAPAATSTGFPLVGVVALAAVLVGTAVAPYHDAVLLVEGLVGLAVAAVGIVVAHDGVGTALVSGTVLDTLLRHLFPVLLFGAMIPITGLAVVAGSLAGVPVLNRALALHVQVVFVVMTATALMTATIRLRQNLAGLYASE